MNVSALPPPRFDVKGGIEQYLPSPSVLLTQGHLRYAMHSLRSEDVYSECRRRAAHTNVATAS